jgi:hypothetical protein
MNLHRLGPEFRKRLHERRAESFELMLQFMRLAEIVESFNGTWSLELRMARLLFWMEN